MSATVLKFQNLSSSLSARLLLPVAATVALLMIPAQAHADRDRDGYHGDRNYYQNQRHDDYRDYRQNNRRDNWYGNKHYYKHHYQAPRYQARVVYTQPYYYNRPVVNYYGSGYGAYAPRYVVGQRLGYYQPVPQHVMYRLRPAPYGHHYGMNGNNVFLLRQNDNVITQIFSLLLQ